VKEQAEVERDAEKEAPEGMVATLEQPRGLASGEAAEIKVGGGEETAAAAAQSLAVQEKDDHVAEGSGVNGGDGPACASAVERGIDEQEEKEEEDVSRASWQPLPPRIPPTI